MMIPTFSTISSSSGSSSGSKCGADILARASEGREVRRSDSRPTGPPTYHLVIGSHRLLPISGISARRNYLPWSVHKRSRGSDYSAFWVVKLWSHWTGELASDDWMNSFLLNRDIGTTRVDAFHFAQSGRLFKSIQRSPHKKLKKRHFGAVNALDIEQINGR